MFNVLLLLCQIRRIRRSLDANFAATLVHALIAFRVDYCNTVLAEAPKDHHPQVSTGAQRGSSSGQWNPEIWSRLVPTASFRTILAGRVQYKLGVTVHRCLQNKAPQYLMDCCTRTSDVSVRQRLKSANRRQLMVPRHCRSMWLTELLRCGSDEMELASKLSPGPCLVYQQLQIGSEDSYFRNGIVTSSASSALEALSDAL